MMLWNEGKKKVILRNEILSLDLQMILVSSDVLTQTLRYASQL